MKGTNKKAVWFAYIPTNIDVGECFHEEYGNIYALHLKPNIKAKKKIKVTIEEV